MYFIAIITISTVLCCTDAYITEYKQKKGNSNDERQQKRK